MYNGNGSVRLGLKRSSNSSIKACWVLLRKYPRPISCTRSRVSIWLLAKITMPINSANRKICAT
ncbi:hypothetical protein PFLmoz3_00908 [Pseudomonas fluorescens]|uniref:Uncharacterized protein n=1 Tax=Pseudomonas fluorescens TaxID=294 RepID=A0A120G8W6_PSEFL|nr:hypothetical protein PFLmoz3_00908 [Pseudomonas fluorescens]